MSKIIEHVVLFKFKDSDPSKVNAVVDGLNGLNSLDQVLHLTAGPILRIRSPSLKFTHMLHARYNSKEDLSSYSLHPEHLRVATELGDPIREDIMAVDWVVDDLGGPVVPPPASAMRITILKSRDGLCVEEKTQVLTIIVGITKTCFGPSDQITFGENFSQARGKGYSIGLLSVYSDLSRLESNVAVKLLEEKLGNLLDDVMCIDFLI